MLVPSEIGPYRIEEVLRTGGTSIVYRAVQDTLERPVALKVLAPHLEHDPVAVKRFRQEAVSAANLKHPNIVVIHVAKVDAPPPYYIAMEFLEGGSLADRLGEGRRLAGAEALRIARQASEGLDHAHRQGLVHCDIKPGNIMFHADGRVAITDFGISRVVDQTTAAISNERSGTLEYMSPEQVRGEDLDRRSDVYSLGVVVYQMLTGRTPFRGSARLVVMRQILDDLPPSPRGINSDIPSRVDAVLLKALAKDRVERHRDAVSFYGELSGAYRQRSSRLKIALAATLIVLAGLVVLVMSRQKPPQSSLVPMPTLTGLTLEKAREQKDVRAYELTLAQGNGMYRHEPAEGLIYEQDPEPAAFVTKGGRVTVFLSWGPPSKTVQVCTKTGMLPGPGCETQPAQFREGSEPTARCTSCQQAPTVTRDVCAKHSMLLAGPWCRSVKKTFVKGREPTARCTSCQQARTVTRDVCAKHPMLLAGRWCPGVRKTFAKGTEPTAKCSRCIPPPSNEEQTKTIGGSNDETR